MSITRWARAAGLLLTCLLGALGGSPGVQAARADATWQFAPAEAPPAPAGASPSPFPAALGPVGQIAFWSPNRGVLITAGNGLVPAGVYAYDGVSWHQLSNVCGGHEGRIAWAGPDEFWTISDQRPGQLISGGEEGSRLWDVSLCHFDSGKVVGSYAMPLEEAGAYRPMDAAACSGPEDCWFGGELGEGEDGGAFHLYWDGSTVTAVYSPQDHAVASMAVEEEQIYESVQLAPGDVYAANESSTDPPLLHQVVASDPGDVFHNLFPDDTQNPGCPPACRPLPEYGTASGGKPVSPDTLAGFALSSDWSPSGEGPEEQQLWAIAGSDATAPAPGQGGAHPIALRYFDEQWTQVVPNLVSLAAGEEPASVAAVPGQAAAWVSIRSEDDEAHADLLSSGDGGKTWSMAQHVDLGPEQGAGPRGDAGAIACPAEGECWLATSQGWLFHLSDGAALAPDTDAFFDGQDGVITYRPPDNGVPEALPFQPPEDDSLANQQPPEPPPPAVTQEAQKAKPKKLGPLVKHVHSKVVRGGSRGAGDVLELTFTLTAKARVELIASGHGHVLAHTARAVLRKGTHTLRLALDPSRWPSKLNLQAKRLGD